MDKLIEFGLYQSCRNEGSIGTCVCGFSCGGVVGGGVGSGLGPGSGEVGWYYVCVSCEVWIICVDGRSRYLCIVFDYVAPYGYLLPSMYLFIANITIPDSFVGSTQAWISLDITLFCKEQ